MSFPAPLVAALALVVFGCSLENEAGSEAAELALTDGVVYTVNPDQEWAEAIHVQDGRIAFVGSTEEVLSRASSDARRIDLNRRFVLPGLHDVHAHPLEARSPLVVCELDSQETDAEAFIRELQRCAPDRIATDWVLGFGHSIFTLLEANRLPRDILDEAIPDRPAAIMEESSHSVWVNSLALQAAGITRETPDPPGGVIVRHINTGQPTGLLFDSAGDLVFDLAWQPTQEIEDLNYQGLLEAVTMLNQAGITSVSEGRTYWRRNFQDAWLRAEREGRLTVRAVLSLWVYPSQPDETQIPALRALHRDNSDDLVRISEIKAYSDGILINSTAAMLAPYLETLGDIPSNNGLNYIDEARLTRYVQELGPDGFMFHIHAIGDRGVREALNAIEAAQLPGARHRLTHLEVVDEADIARFGALGVVADMQVAGDFTQPASWSENEFLIGDRAHPLVPLRSFHDAGTHLTLSSDWDVSALSPFVGMQNALTRAPQALPDVATVIRAYTINAAYALRQEDRVGSIEVGKLADLVVVDQNLFEVPVQNIARTRVVMTLLGGQVVYER